MNELRSPTPENEIRRQKFDGLMEGLRNKEDPVTWRTLIVDLRNILGSNNPEWTPPLLERIEPAKVLIKRLTEGTYVEELQSEILWGCFGEYGEEAVLPNKEEISPLDYLLINSRHKSQELIWKTADALKAQGKSVAVINPVGHYNDNQTRMVVPDLLVRPVKHAIFLTSTQNQDGGNVEVLNLTLRALRNPNFAYMIDYAHVFIPMFGGSRGHKPGQAKGLGFEALETIYIPKDIMETIFDIEDSISGPHKYEVYSHVLSMRSKLVFPPVDYSTVDIHNGELPGKKFIEANRKFESLSPALELASECMHVISETPFSKLPKRFIACDEGSRGRTEELAEEILRQGKKEVEIVYIDKTRIRAGEVADSKVAKIVVWKLNKKGEIVKEELKKEDMKFKRQCILIYVDDMIDTGKTAAIDDKSVKSIFTNSKYTIFIATHPIFSHDVGEALSRMAGIDTFIVGDTLSNSRFKTYQNIKYVDFGPTIARSLPD
jgi:hypothetical protein